jgi:hypothetical protein
MFLKADKERLERIEGTVCNVQEHVRGVSLTALNVQLKALAEGQQRIEQGQNVLKADLDGLPGKEQVIGLKEAVLGLSKHVEQFGERLAAIEQLIEGLHGSYDLVLSAGVAKGQPNGHASSKSAKKGTR